MKTSQSIHMNSPRKAGRTFSVLWVVSGADALHLLHPLHLTTPVSTISALALKDVLTPHVGPSLMTDKNATAGPVPKNLSFRFLVSPWLAVSKMTPRQDRWGHQQWNSYPMFLMSKDSSHVFYTACYQVPNSAWCSMPILMFQHPEPTITSTLWSSAVWKVSSTISPLPFQ